MNEIGSLILIGALLLFAIHTLSKQESDDNNAARDVNISITTEKIVIGDDLFSSEIDGIDDIESN